MTELKSQHSSPAGIAIAPPPVSEATEVGSRAPSVSHRPDRHPDQPAAQPALAHPALFLDPHAWTVHAVRALRAHGVPVVVLSPARLDPASAVRGVRRQHLPPIAARPERWQAALLEFAARLEPRPALYACSPAAAALLERSRRALEPHYVLANVPALDHPASRVPPDNALRDALTRSEAALEVQLVVDVRGRCTGAAVLAWAAGAPPDVLVTSVAGTEVRARSEHWLAARGIVGYARLVWSPDRFGRLTLQAASRLPGPGLVFAALDGLDLVPRAHAATFGFEMPAAEPACRLVRRLAVGEPDLAGVLQGCAPVEFRWRDPLPGVAAFLRSLKRS